MWEGAERGTFIGVIFGDTHGVAFALAVVSLWSVYHTSVSLDLSVALER